MDAYLVFVLIVGFWYFDRKIRRILKILEEQSPRQ
jgi:hypothetical protein